MFGHYIKGPACAIIYIEDDDCKLLISRPTLVSVMVIIYFEGYDVKTLENMFLCGPPKPVDLYTNYPLHHNHYLFSTLFLNSARVAFDDEIYIENEGAGFVTVGVYRECSLNKAVTVGKSIHFMEDNLDHDLGFGERERESYL